MFEFLSDGLNTVVDDVVDGFNLDSIFPSSMLETGGVKRFPKDLSDKHYGKLRIEFTAYDNKGIRLTEKTATSVADAIKSSGVSSTISGLVSGTPSATGQGYSLTKNIQDGATSLFSNLVDEVESVAGSIWDSAKTIWNRDATTTSTLSLATAKTFTNVGTWQLFIPQSISTSYSANWDKTNLQFLGKALDAMAAKVPGGSEATDALKLINGEALNPVSELLFNGMDHRSFSYTFTLFPKNAEESQLAQDMIKFFKTNMTAQISPNTMSMILRYPNYFKIRYLFNSKDNPYINKIAMCVLTNFTVNYQDNAPAFHRDGSPVAYTLNLEFKEIEPIYRDMIESQGY
jgi:hypothetical protein